MPDSIPVEMHLLRGLAYRTTPLCELIQYSNMGCYVPHIAVLNQLAHCYKTDADEVNEWHPQQPQVRRVVRRITSTFWFFREVRQYGKDCIIVSPDEVRDRFKQDLLHMQDLRRPARNSVFTLSVGCFTPHTQRECVSPDMIEQYSDTP